MMPGYLPRNQKPRPTLSVTQMLTVKQARKAMWADWIEECAMIQDAFVESMISQLPSFKERE